MGKAPMDVRDAAVVRGDAGDEARAVVGGVPLRILLPSGSARPLALGDAIVLSSLVPAMRTGATLRLPTGVPVSTVLMAALPALQRAYRDWNAGLAIVAVDAETYVPSGPGQGVGLFYAGGVDSAYSLIAHEAEIDTLVDVFGFDMTLSEEDMLASRERNGAFAQSLGKRMVFVESNQRDFLRAHGVSRTFAYGAMLAGVAHLLGFARCYIASGQTAGYLRPDGSHPVVDPLCSNGVTGIVHDDVSVGRLDKTKAIAARPAMLANLRVCWDDPNDNCGRCIKCARTMAALRLCGVQGPFPQPLDRPLLRRLATRSEPDFLIELALESHRTGDTWLERGLLRGLRRQDLREALRYLLYALTMRKVRKPGGDPVERALVKVDLRPDLDLRRPAPRLAEADPVPRHLAHDPPREALSSETLARRHEEVA